MSIPGQPPAAAPAAPPAAPAAPAAANPNPPAAAPGQQVAPPAQQPAAPQQPQNAQPSDPAKPPAPTAQQPWDAIKLPDGTKPDKLSDGFTKLAKDKGWSQQQAQDAADWFFQATAEMKKNDDAAYRKLIADDVTALRGDPEFGGPNFDRTNAAASSFVAQFDDKDGSAAKLLETLGAKTAPAVVKLLARARAAIAEDNSPFPKNGQGAPDNSSEGRARRMFPNSPGMWTKK